MRSAAVALIVAMQLTSPAAMPGLDRDAIGTRVTATVLATSVPAEPDADAAQGAAPPPTSATTRLTSAERELVATVSAQFALVGLEIPDVEITFHEDAEPCRGAEGRFTASGGRRHVAVCVADRGTFASDLHRRRTLTHEFAHAWDHANLDDDRRSGLLAILGATNWNDPSDAWDERGIERFAETLTWGLYDQRRRPVLIDVPCRELHADFVAITNHDATGPLYSVCTTADDLT
jgi:hypothetical protein